MPNDGSSKGWICSTDMNPQNYHFNCFMVIVIVES